jgi:putative endonuclease
MIKKDLWFVYLLSCFDKTIYTGATNNIEKRLHDHNFTKKGSKYTSTRRPVSLLNYFGPMSKSEALKLEFKIKRMSKAEKLKL